MVDIYIRLNITIINGFAGVEHKCYIYKTQILNDTWLIIPSVGGFLLLYKTVGRKHKKYVNDWSGRHKSGLILATK